MEPGVLSIFAKDQPRDGDTIMHCGHCIGIPGHVHWFKYEEPIKFQRPDGSRGQAAWFVACEPCFFKHGKRVTDFARGDARWHGNEPVVEREEA